MKCIDCTDIYTREFDKKTQSTKRLMELWLSSPSTWDYELFQYAEPDFYFYRYIIDRQERGVEQLLTNIMYALMERYGIEFDVPQNRKNAPFAFIIHDGKRRVGFRLYDFYENENVSDFLRKYKLDAAYIIRLQKSNISKEQILIENERYRKKEINLRVISLRTFFKKYFGDEEYKRFEKFLDRHLNETKEIIGYKPIKFLSTMNLATQKIYEEKALANWDYRGYKYQVIDENDEGIKKLVEHSNFEFAENIEDMYEKYISKKLFKVLIGTSECAESFLTSEWLFHSLKEQNNFDYTSIISGYLKSIEQLLYKIVMANVDNNCIITMSKDRKIQKKAYENKVPLYRKGKQAQIDLVSNQVEYMDSSIGTFEYFLRYNPHVFTNPSLAKDVANMVKCFREECRNGFFHTHNLKEWSVVEKTRNNAIYLYFVLLSLCLISNEKLCGFGMHESDTFDQLCSKIRKFKRFNSSYIFEYSNGVKQKLIYDVINNTVEFDESGNEHYQSLLFYKVDDFSLKTYEKLDVEIKEEQKLYLTRDNLPDKIFGVHRNHRLEEITID